MSMPPVLAAAFRAHRPALAVTAVFSLAINLLMFTGPFYMISVYDRVLLSRNAGTLLVLSGLAAGALILYGAIELLRSRVLVRAGMIFDRAIGRPLFERLAARDAGLHGGADGQALRDLDLIRDFLTGAAPIVFCDAPWTPLFVVLAYMMHPWLGIASLLGIVGLLVLTLVNEVVTRPALAAATAQAQAAAHVSASAFRNREVVTAMGMARRFAERWSALHEAVLAGQTRASDRAALLVSLSKVFRLILQSGMLGLGAWLVIRHELSVGAMFATNLLMARALAPIEQLVQHWKSFVLARAAHARLAIVLAGAGETRTAMALPAPKGRVQVEQLSVRAPGAARAGLAGVSFRLEAGEMLTVVGSSGAGKSTLLRALVNVWRPAIGCVRLDGATLDQYAPEVLGDAVGYLPQDIELFAGTVSDNIARFGAVDAGKVVAAARRAGVHELILRLPQGYDTDIGSGGAVLSGGQRQRIGLARALYDLPALIVLDEPNSNLDAGGETALAQAIAAARAAGCTVIVSSHKPALVDMADKLLVLADGAQQMFGSRAEVLTKIAPRAVRAA